jgi:hypothetical protein
VHGAHVATRLGRDARLRSTSVTYGGALVRVNETVDYTAPGGDAELRGVSLAGDGQHLEHRLLVDHTAPHCRSRVTYKNALQGDRAHTVWIGDVVIRAGATGTDTYELNRNLLLTPEARADSVPNLEIETGEISGAGHASATGRFDDEQLFYLQSRGIPADVARRMVVRGFFAEVVEQIGVPELQERLMAQVESELARTLERDRRDRPPGGSAVRAGRRHRVRVDGAGGRCAWRAAAVRSARRATCARTPDVSLSEGDVEDAHRRVLAARVALRPAHGLAHRSAGRQARAHLPRDDRGDDVYVAVEDEA